MCLGALISVGGVPKNVVGNLGGCVRCVAPNMWKEAGHQSLVFFIIEASPQRARETSVHLLKLARNRWGGMIQCRWSRV